MIGSPGRFFNVAITSNGLVKIDFTAKQFDVPRAGLRDFAPDERNDPEFLHLKAIFDKAKDDPFSMVSISDYNGYLNPIFPSNKSYEISRYDDFRKRK